MKIICYGDSYTWGYDPRGYLGGRYDHPWPEILAGKLGCSVCNWGENGREIPGRAAAFPEDADLLIVMLGTNDLLQGASADTVCRRMERFLEPMDPEKVLLIAPPPMKLGTWVPDRELICNSTQLAAHYRTLATGLGVRFADAGAWNIPIGYDGVHLTEEGHRILAENIANLLKRGEPNDSLHFR